jgi:hypothetical protein
MAWVSDLVSATGLPAGAATFAVAMYAACAAAEKAARPEALKDIASILKSASWSRSSHPAAIIERVFKLTFGERHLSWKCIGRSVTASVLIVTILDLYQLRMQGAVPEDEPDAVVFLIAMAILILMYSVVPDYLALWKTRVLLSWSSSRSGVLWVCGADIFLSLCISSGLIVLISEVVAGQFTISGRAPLNILQGLILREIPLVFGEQHHKFAMYGPIMLSTLFTSVWTILILLSTTVVKLLTPLQRFTRWFFDVEKHPIEAIGIVTGALVIIASLAWSLVRAIV